MKLRYMQIIENHSGLKNASACTDMKLELINTYVLEKEVGEKCLNDCWAYYIKYNIIRKFLCFVEK